MKGPQPPRPHLHGRAPSLAVSAGRRARLKNEAAIEQQLEDYADKNEIPNKRWPSEKLKMFVLNEEAPEVRRDLAITALEQQRDTSIVPFLKSFYNTTKSKNLKWGALLAIGRLDRNGQREFLASVAEQESDDGIRDLARSLIEQQ